MIGKFGLDLFDMRVNGCDRSAVFITIPTLPGRTPSPKTNDIRDMSQICIAHASKGITLPSEHVHSSRVSPLDSTGQPLHGSTDGSRRKLLGEH